MISTYEHIEDERIEDEHIEDIHNRILSIDGTIQPDDSKGGPAVAVYWKYHGDYAMLVRTNFSLI